MEIVMNTIVKTGCIALVAITTAVGLSACVSDGYSTGYSSFSLGVSSYDRPYDYGYGYGYRAYGDRDGDGVPNWADRRPRNPWRD
jgi:hypothetical protein